MRLFLFPRPILDTLDASTRHPYWLRAGGEPLRTEPAWNTLVHGGSSRRHLPAHRNG
jgi:hypothetical protein